MYIYLYCEEKNEEFKIFKSRIQDTVTNIDKPIILRIALNTCSCDRDTIDQSMILYLEISRK